MGEWGDKTCRDSKEGTLYCLGIVIYGGALSSWFQLRFLNDCLLIQIVHWIKSYRIIVSYYKMLGGNIIVPVPSDKSIILPCLLVFATWSSNDSAGFSGWNCSCCKRALSGLVLSLLLSRRCVLRSPTLIFWVLSR